MFLYSVSSRACIFQPRPRDTVPSRVLPVAVSQDFDVLNLSTPSPCAPTLRQPFFIHICCHVIDHFPLTANFTLLLPQNSLVDDTRVCPSFAPPENPVI